MRRLYNLRTKTNKEQTMNLTKSAAVLAAIFASTLFLAACEKKGPMERAGEKVDNTIEKAKDAVKK